MMPKELKKLLLGKKLILMGYAVFVLSLGVVFAVQSGYLNFRGDAFVTEFNLGDTLPVFPIRGPTGHYFESTNLTSKLNYGPETWVGDTFTLNLIKPTILDNQGNESFTMSFQVINPTELTWTSGTITHTAGATVGNNIGTGIFNTSKTVTSTSVSPAATVNPGQTVTISFTFSTKILLTGTDYLRLKISYVLAGAPRYLNIDVYFRLNNWVP